jgi:hypothetical protein
VASLAGSGPRPAIRPRTLSTEDLEDPKVVQTLFQQVITELNLKARFACGPFMRLVL